MFFVPFHDFYPDLAEAETRSVMLTQPTFGVPADSYGMVDLYCNEPGCDCRRVMLMVIAKQRGPLAVIAYGWESVEFYARWMKSGQFIDAQELKGPILNFGSPQSKYALALLRMVDQLLLSDPAYIQRLKRHYQMVRDAVNGETAHSSEAAHQRRRDRAKRKRVLARKLRDRNSLRSQKRRAAR